MKEKAMQSTTKLISLVIPMFNEAENIIPLYEEIQASIRPLKYRFEIIFIDDGSTDGTLTVIQGLADKDHRVKALSFSRNFGHQAALMAGLEVSGGDAVITMDGDLQHPPRLIPTLVQRWEEGNDVVYTVRREAPGSSRLKLATARWFYLAMSRIGDIDIPANTADFRLVSGEVVKHLRNLGERCVFLRGMVRWVGFRQAAVEFDADPRFAGRTKYSMGAMLRFALEGMTSFSNVPLYIALYFGFFVSFLSFLHVTYVIYARFFLGHVVPGWASIFATVLFLGGVQLSTIGMVGLYLGKVFLEVRRRPRYIIRQTLGYDKR